MALPQHILVGFFEAIIREDAAQDKAKTPFAVDPPQSPFG
jgi:hypothetical protein